MTGNIFENRKEIRENISALTAIYKEYFQKKEQQTQRGENLKKFVSLPSVSNITPEEIIKIIEHSKQASKFQRLFSGDISNYKGDSSAADLALCRIIAFYSKDHSTIEAVLNQSELAKREKWQKRPKYLKDTIEKAIASCTGQYERKYTTEKQKTNESSTKTLEQELESIYLPIRNTDKGNAERFQAVFENQVVHTPELGWIVWNGKYWQVDERAAQKKFKHAVTEELYKEIETATKERKKDKIEAFCKWLKQSQTAKIVQSGLIWAKSNDCFRKNISDFDKDIYTFNLENGTIDLKTGMFKKHNPKDKITKISNVQYDKTATCP
ncbi:MAG: hypothetical protein HQM08_29770, partial [Candidatus Riflebacteria bacterium]|nr:hypothetical protein [Candidatus Riflebacteria bacterium]